MRRNIYWLSIIFFLIILDIFQAYRLTFSLSKANIYKILLSNAAGVLPDKFVDTTKNEVKADSLFGEGIYLVATISPKDCPACMDDEIAFLKDMHKEIPALSIRLVIAYYPSKDEIGPWLEEWGLNFPYYFDRQNMLERENKLRSSAAWNILIKNGRIITSFLPEKNYLAKGAIFTFLTENIRHIE